MFAAKEILDIAIKLEKNGENVYKKAMEEISNPDLAKLLKWMMNEEVEHGKWFKLLKDDIETESKNPIADEMGKELLSQIIGDQTFSLKDVDFSKIETTDELIKTFIEFEKDTILFYEMLQPFINDSETQKKLNSIIEEENNHIRRLSGFMENENRPLIFTKNNVGA